LIEKSDQLMIARLVDWWIKSVLPTLETAAEPATTCAPCGALHANPAGSAANIDAIARTRILRLRATVDLISRDPAFSENTNRPFATGHFTLP
jgi:hypothetical protein